MNMTAILNANVAEMVDLAINYPEMGCVDFNMLLNVLHILIHKLELKEKPVEVHSDETLVPPLQPANTVKVSELYAEEAGQETGDTVLVVKRDTRPDAGDEQQREGGQKSGTDAIRDKTQSKMDSEKKVSTADPNADAKSSGRDEDGQVTRDNTGSQTLYENEQEIDDETQSQNKDAHVSHLPQKDVKVGVDKVHSHVQHGDSRVDHGRTHSQGVDGRSDVGKQTKDISGEQTGDFSSGDSLIIEQEAGQLTDADLAPFGLWKKIRLLELKVQKCCDQILSQDNTSGAADASSREQRGYLSPEDQMTMLITLRENLDDLVRSMADKADLRHLARKVSNEQFEFVCDDIAKAVTDTLNKINAQEELWQLALDDVQRHIETKLDRMELAPIKDFFTTKFRALQINLQKIADLKREVEAAGTTKTLMRGLNCIACDADRVMNTKAAPCIPVSKPVHAQTSIKPYLTYELDAVRKERANAPKNRNLKDWEILDKQMRQPVKVRSATDQHLCSRYCGGAHTVTTPSQRVARLGHFLQQWGPECFPLSQAMAAGDVKDTKKLKGGKRIQEKRPHSPGRDERKKLKVVECTCTGSF